MKDNFPNYLNPHNIDPSRIDVPPGNDSIRPLRDNKVEQSPVEIVGDEITIDPKSYRVDVAPGFDSIRPLCAPTMSNDEAIRILADIETDIYGRVAIWKAIEALKKIPDPET